MDDHTEDNRHHWETLAALHPDTDYYDIESFLDGQCTLDPVEREELGDVEGKTLLHLMCHLGLDTLSWARRGAEVTGVDFSETAVETARELAATTGLADRSRFIESDVYELSDALEDRFDVVYTSFGVLFWLDDLDGWADVVVRHLRPGGTFYIADLHPFQGTLDETSTGQQLRVAHPYFSERITYDPAETGSYAGLEPTDLHNGPTHGWTHSLGEIVTALANAGLRIEFLHEYPWTTFQALAAMEQRDHGRYYLPASDHEYPFVFTLRAARQ